MDFQADRLKLTADAADLVTHVLPLELQLTRLVRSLHALNPDSNLASVRSTFELQILGKSLLLSAHEFSHGRFNFSDDILCFSIAIDHHELQMLLPLKEIVHMETRLEDGVQVILDLLGSSDLVPQSCFGLLEKFALRIRLAESVQVPKLGATDKKIDLHTEHICLLVDFYHLLLFLNKI